MGKKSVRRRKGDQDEPILKAQLAEDPPISPSTVDSTTAQDTVASLHFQLRDLIRHYESGQKLPLRTRFCSFLFAGMHLLSLSLLVYGIGLQRDFCHGEECDMTYSVRNYLEVPIIALDHKVPHYRLYKFVDGRDTRWQPTIRKQKQRPDKPAFMPGESYCSKDPHVVVFIPGHWGSYQQCRSLGAHGLGWTRQKHSRTFSNEIANALRNGTSNGTSRDLYHFSYDTFCVDFAEQGGGLHSSILWEQVSFVVDAVEQISRDCNVSDVTLVGHSVGGLVAREVAFEFPELMLIRNIVTLATPHAGMPYTYDAGVRDFIQGLDNYGEEGDYDIAIISLSGGMRDTLIPPESTLVDWTYESEGMNDSHHAAMSVHAPFVMEKGNVEARTRPHAGMDHKAIAWCHNLLYTVRRMIFFLKESLTIDQSARKRLTVVWKHVLFQFHQHPEMGNESYNFDQAFDRDSLLMANSVGDDYGFFGLAALSTAMLYNASPLLAFYALICGLYSEVLPPSIAHDSTSMMMNFFALAFLFSRFSWVPIIASVPLVFLAHSLLLSIQEGSAWIRRKTAGRKVFHESMWVKLGLFLWFLHYVVVASLHLVGVIPKFRFSVQYVGFSAFTAVCPHNWLQAFGVLFNGSNCRGDGHDFVFASLVLLTWPCFVAGPLYALHWSYFQENAMLNSIVSFWFLVAVMMPVRSRLDCGRSELRSKMEKTGRERVQDDAILRIIFRFLGLAVVTKGTFALSKPAGGVDLAYYLTALCILDWLKQLFLWLSFRHQTKSD